MNRVATADLKNKRVLVRCDFNVPLDDQGNILDDFKIRKSIPTIKLLIKKRAKIILMSHLGDPKGKETRLKMDVIQDRLMEYLDLSIVKAPGCVGSSIEKWTKDMRAGEILLLENLRFCVEEKENKESFAKALSRLADIYVNDAFASSHRAHASVSCITKFLPAFAGLLLEKEVNALSRVMQDPVRPLVALIGGAKIESKALVINSFLEKADYLILGGKVANSVLEGKGVFKSKDGLSEKELKIVKDISFNSKLHLPLDALASADILGESYVRESNFKDVKVGELLLDIGPLSITNFSKIIEKAGTIVWSGPFGLFENPLFLKGTLGVAKAIADNKAAFKVAGGGETSEFIIKNRLASKFNHVSTGGGAMLEFLSGNKLPGIEALKYG